MIGVVSNPFSDGNGGRARLWDTASGAPEVVFAAPHGHEALSRALADFARRGVTVLAVDGGDGTIRDVLSELPRAFGADWPAIAVLPSGKTNLVARDVGTFGAGETGLRRLIEWYRGGAAASAAVERPCLEVVWSDDPDRVLRGLLMGAGVFTHGTRMAGTWAHDRGIKQRGAVALTMLRLFWDCLRGRSLEVPSLALLPEDDDTPAPTSQASVSEPHFLVLATTLNRLMLGFWPFSRQGRGGLHWLGVTFPPRGLSRALWAAWRGRMDEICDRRREYRSGRTDRLRIRLDAPFVVDGEIYEPGDGGVVVRAGPMVRFLAG